MVARVVDEKLGLGIKISKSYATASATYIPCTPVTCTHTTFITKIDGCPHTHVFAHAFN